MKYYFETITRNYFYFDGRARRREFWWFVLFYILILLILSFADRYFGWMITVENSQGETVLYFWKSSFIYVIATAIPRFAITARRLHDFGKSGWLQLIIFIPCIGWMILVILCAQDSQRWDNQYGPNPKRRHRY